MPRENDKHGFFPVTVNGNSFPMKFPKILFEIEISKKI